MPENRLCAAWGCTALSTGYTRIGPGQPYPPRRHPDDHHFAWARGRRLQAFQVVLVSEGRGVLDAGTPAQRTALGANDLFVLFPGVWHRYAPDPATGWVENWIEVRGAAFDDAVAQGILRPDRPLHPADDDFFGVFATVHRLARTDALGNQPILSTLGLQLLALLCRPATGWHNGDGRVVQQAKALISERCAEPLAMEAVARELGLSYSSLRQAFRRHGGTSPKQYQLLVRMNRAKDLLTNTALPMKAIAAHLGFSSPYHFASQFRQCVGLPPSAWRLRVGAKSPG